MVTHSYTVEYIRNGLLSTHLCKRVELMQIWFTSTLLQPFVTCWHDVMLANVEYNHRIYHCLTEIKLVPQEYHCNHQHLTDTARCPICFIFLLRCNRGLQLNCTPLPLLRAFGSIIKSPSSENGDVGQKKWRKNSSTVAITTKEQIWK